MPKYLLAGDCFVRRLGCHWIVLDVRRDRYYCLQHEDLLLIGDRVAGCEGMAAAESSPRPDRGQAAATLRSLVSKGLITSDSSLGKPFVEACLPRHLEVLVPQDGSRAVSAKSLLLFFAACMRVDWSLRKQPIAAIVARLRRRHERLAGARQEERERAARLVATFNRLRPLYPRAYRCLFDSLALREFLAAYGLSTKIVFGVAADPFQAHCWLQLGTTLLNEDDERVRRFDPIMSA